ncbi:response regulator [Oceanispirochaeta sp. M1]|nr:response regulator [Oceanispirochaeta sp. M1]RDG30518.1 response regulator [Oceanispirochaeta sp. M1]
MIIVMKILIIDDSGVMRRIHKNTLIENKIPEEALIEAADGQEALQLASKNDITLFLVDWNMPKLDGLEFVERLRNTERYKTTPIIMVTSEAAKYNVIQAITAGVTDYVVKPIQGSILWDKVSNYIKSE